MLDGESPQADAGPRQGCGEGCLSCTYDFTVHDRVRVTCDANHIFRCALTSLTRDWPRRTLYVRPASVKCLRQKLVTMKGPALYTRGAGDPAGVQLYTAASNSQFFSKGAYGEQLAHRCELPPRGSTANVSYILLP
mgnify:CR=1 FL=1